MRPRETKFGIGWIIADCLMMVEVIIEIYTGELTWPDLLLLILLSIILGISVVVLIKRYKRK